MFWDQPNSGHARLSCNLILLANTVARCSAKEHDEIKCRGTRAVSDVDLSCGDPSVQKRMRMIAGPIDLETRCFKLFVGCCGSDLADDLSKLLVRAFTQAGQWGSQVPENLVGEAIRFVQDIRELQTKGLKQLFENVFTGDVLLTAILRAGKNL